MENHRKKFYDTVIVFVSVMLMLLSGCGKEIRDNHKSSLEDFPQKEEYKYQADFAELDIDVDSIFNVCIKDEKLYMLGRKALEENNNFYQKYFLVSCEMDGSNVGQNQISLEKGESTVFMAVDGKDQLRILTESEESGKEKEYSIKALNVDGTIAESCSLHGKAVRENDFYIIKGNNVITRDGCLYNAGETEIRIFNSEGKQKKTIDFKEHIHGIFQAGDGNIYVYGDNTEDSIELKKIDIKTGELSEAMTWEDYRIVDRSIFGDEEGGIYVDNGNSIYNFNMESGKLNVLFTYLDCAVDSDAVQDILPDGNGGFLAVCIEDGKENPKTEFVIIKHGGASDVEEQKILKLACVFISDSVKENVLAFNRANQDYKIEVKEYSIYEDYAEQFNLDMVSGKMADILSLDRFPADIYMKKGMLADLYPLIEKDEEISKEDFIDSIRTTVEQDGKLYYMGPTFGVNGLVGGKDILEKYMGAAEGWNMEELEAFYETMPEDAVFLWYRGREEFLASMVRAQMGSYIDWKTGEVRFDSEDFIRLIKFSNNIPLYNEIDYHYSEREKFIKNGRMMLDEFSLADLTDIQRYTELFQPCGGFRVMSYPMADNNIKLSMKFSMPAMAIMETCDDKEGAWKFLRRFLMYDYQIKGGNDIFSSVIGIPVRKDAFEKKLEYAMAEESYSLEDGTLIEPNSIYGPMTAEEAEQVRSIVDRVGSINGSYDSVSDKISEIISEEAKAYYAGDKTAEETAEIIQNRVKILVSENS